MKIKTHDKILTISLVSLALLMGLGGAFFMPFVLAFGFLVIFPVAVAFIAILTFRLVNHYIRREDRQEQRTHTVNFDWSQTMDWTSPTAVPQPHHLIAQPAADEIALIKARDMEELVSLLPSDSNITHTFGESGGLWRFYLHSRSSQSDFVAEGYGPTPRAAFMSARQSLMQELKDWRLARDEDRQYASPLSVAMPSSNSAQAAVTASHVPTALIVDDDVDAARATASLFEKMGCKTLLSSDIKDAHCKILQEDVDFIVLDWLLGDKERGDQVMSQANQFIESFDDLENRFSKKQPKIITYSVLDKSQIDLPESKYFSYYDHWRKPFKYKELEDRTSQLMAASGY